MIFFRLWRSACFRSRRRVRGQSLVELALVAPILIVLAMAVWDGGSVLREQVVLQQAARDGARVAATGYGTSVLDTVVADAVVASARDLPGVSSAISYPDPLSVQVRVTYTHSLITPVLRQLWAGGGTINLQASATFYLPHSTPVPATLVLPTSTPSPTLTPTLPPTPTPSATSTPTPTATPTSTPTPGITTCRRAITIPALDSNTGYWFIVQLNVPSYLDATWTMPDGAKENIELFIYANSPTDPFAGQPDPTSLSPPSGELVSDRGTTSSLEIRTPQSNLTGRFSVYFFKRGQSLSTPTDAVLEYQSRQCP